MVGDFLAGDGGWLVAEEEASWEDNPNLSRNLSKENDEFGDIIFLECFCLGKRARELPYPLSSLGEMLVSRLQEVLGMTDGPPAPEVRRRESRCEGREWREGGDDTVRDVYVEPGVE